MEDFFVNNFNSIRNFISGIKIPGFATMMFGVTLISLIVIFAWGFIRIRNIKKDNVIITDYGLLDTEKESKPLFKLSKKDFIIMLAMAIFYAIPAIYNLGGLNVPETGWAPSGKDDGVIIDLGKNTQVSKLMLYQGYNEEKYDGTKFQIKYLNADNIYVDLETIDKTGFYSWKATAKEFTASKIKIVPNGPGAAINEIAVFEKASDIPLNIKSITSSNENSGAEPIQSPDGKAYSISNLADEQEKADFYTKSDTSTYFDEVFYPRTALDFIYKINPFERTHPPLGKYFVMAGMLIFGVNPFGWRIVGTLFGIAMIPLMYLFGLKIFKNRFYAFCTAFLMMFDFMHFVQTRISTIDVYVTFFVILMYYYIYDYFVKRSYKMGFKKSVLPLFLCGLTFGIGIATKWIAMYAAVGIFLIFIIAKLDDIACYTAYRKSGLCTDLFGSFWSKYFFRTALACVLFFLVIPSIIYFASYASVMQVPGNGVKEFFNNQVHMYTFHNELNIKHSYSSPWWAWPIMVKPIWYFGSKAMAAEKLTSSIICMGNPLIWWLSIPALIAGIIFAIKRKDKYMIVPIFGALYQYIPWMVVRRMTFIYHYFSVIPFIMIVMVYLMKIFSEYGGKKARRIIYAYLLLTALLFIIFYPILSGMIVPRWYASILQWFPGWSFRY
ncbi:dolichyl-phosphate-mannose-protein mannosyltransferase [Ruminiclostridium sufflavum DSM 19573]|uniref:Polyprenol-phosphate-mannose--protein mannosyltransferase n=1 Tax=Ruminiclostridium sufflavum DSM 19573 TaxID=1121337 RepID=A0A318XV07_9FIRM|nr:phospholipid carrier-dependent glycosyltransferase [Ruminiclostridium sufflavum]PYG86687.1 dolichyl-phosphate-mannose-protein mannosyltransferase [Ruminiclostridium sufflavum DSM 19573]